MAKLDYAPDDIKALPLFAHLGKETFAQAMLEIAWNGMKAQGWWLGVNSEGSCVYSSPLGRRCVWGLCDTTLNEYDTGSVAHLRNTDVGLAAYLNRTEIEYASQIQCVHDATTTDERVEMKGEDPREVFKERLKSWANEWGLTVPSEEA